MPSEAQATSEESALGQLLGRIVTDDAPEVAHQVVRELSHIQDRMDTEAGRWLEPDELQTLGDSVEQAVIDCRRSSNVIGIARDMGNSETSCRELVRVLDSIACVNVAVFGRACVRCYCRSCAPLRPARSGM